MIDSNVGNPSEGSSQSLTSAKVQKRKESMHIWNSMA